VIESIVYRLTNLYVHLDRKGCVMERMKRTTWISNKERKGGKERTYNSNDGWNTKNNGSSMERYTYKQQRQEKRDKTYRKEDRRTHMKENKGKWEKEWKECQNKLRFYGIRRVTENKQDAHGLNEWNGRTKRKTMVKLTLWLGVYFVT